MAGNIVICSDGTGNTFSEHVSNVTLLIKSLELRAPNAQLVFYDQGLGTNPSLVNVVKAYKAEPGECRTGLEILPEPKRFMFGLRQLARLRGLLFGYGLRENVKEMYKALIQSCHGGEAKLYLFGFSRGAFTVRVLAGLLYRCGLPQSVEDFETCFTEAFEIYKPHAEDGDRITQFKTRYEVRDLEVRFLGLWDTVKAYGGIWPQSLPHLRHNPIVHTVCHALALDERRSWFLPTSWGGIDLDQPKAHLIKPDQRYADQRIKEVWFGGCHSDVGGGDDEAGTARIALRWMLNEAAARGLILNQEGEALRADSVTPETPVKHESLQGWWYLTEYIPRWELNNTYRPPKRLFKWGRRGKRRVETFRRDGEILLHPSVKDRAGLEGEHFAVFDPKAK